MAIPYKEHRDTQVVVKIMNRGVPPRPRDTIPETYAGNALWDLLCSCWSFDPEDRPSAAQIRDRLCTLFKMPALRLVVTEATRIQDLVTYFTKRGLTDYTALLNKRVQVQPTKSRLHSSKMREARYSAQEAQGAVVYRHFPVGSGLTKVARRARTILGDLAMVSPWMSNGCVTEYVVTNPGCNHVALCTQLSRAIAYLHEHNVVHGDIKGPNVLVSDSGIVKITDFGVSIMDHKEVEFSATSTSRGTQKWQASKPLIDNQPPWGTKEGDVYALGMTLTEIYTGQPPYGSLQWSGKAMIDVINGKLRPSRPIQLPPDNSGNRLWELMNDCWATNASERPSSGEVYERLKEM
ncbi:hypothetical protein OPQ81_008438 [Rhizoctonia solani]|nr:hypothetical protein OPQ81_008438 [Rhizoctonia solani]